MDNRLTRNAMTGLVVAGVALLASVPALASSHREAPGITATPKLDGTDFYMFRSYETGRSAFTTLVANYDPVQSAYGGPNYFELDANGRYDININNDGSGTPNLIFRFQFTNTRKNISLDIAGKKVAVPLVNVGPIGVKGNPNDTANENVVETYTVSVIRGTSVEAVTNAADSSATFTKPIDDIGAKSLPNYSAYAKHFIYAVTIPGCTTPGRMFVGQRKDSFAVDLSETFDLLNYAHPVGEQYKSSGVNDLADDNVTSLIMEVPTSCLLGVKKDPVIGGWTTASRTSTADGKTVLTQVSRLGMPLVNELVIGLKDKDKFNASEPVNDGQFLTYVTNPTVPALVEALFATKAPTKFPRNDLVATFLTGIPGINQPKSVVPAEMLRLNTGTAVTVADKQNRLGVIGGDNAGFPNGRRPGDDVVDIVLRVAMGRLYYLGIDGTKADAPSGNLDFTDGAIQEASQFDTTFPYLKPPVNNSPNKS